jgi:hypothetical protein
MKRILTMVGLVATLTILFFSCQKDLSQKGDDNREKLGTLSQLQITATECGTPLVKQLEDMGGVGTWGTVVVSNDENNIIITINSGIAGMYLGRATISYGSHQDVVDDLTAWWSWTPCEGPKTFDIKKTWTPLTVASDTIMIPNSAFQEDGCIWLSVNVELNGDHGTLGCAWASPYDSHIGSAQYQSAFQYCRQECPPQGECDTLRTQTPGGWGAEPNGNNPGTYLHANFNDAFPTGLVIGCNPGNTVTLTTAQAITNLLPTGGKAAALTMDYTNPAEIKNVLVGHMVALTLSVGFDANDADFGKGGVELGDMVINSGVFKGWTVSQFLAEANNILGGCSTAYKIDDVLTTATAINENYVDGKVDKGYLVCPTERF